ncbi:hypothetical protein [Paracoccus siganidrum]|uniref:hypothetical protein n=1 Tax=Paracoccus siganidrum TaxID=1276757 RepID=UPI0011C4909D|nr:hypothetical protein [Paracoccus siganidrum]
MNPKKPHPTYDSPQGPVKDFVRFMIENDEPPQYRSLDEAITAARQSFSEGEDCLCDMGDGFGPRRASKILDDIEDPVNRVLMFERIAANLRRQFTARDCAAVNLAAEMERQASLLRPMIANGGDPSFDMNDGKGIRPLPAILDELDADEAFANAISRDSREA